MLQETHAKIKYVHVLCTHVYVSFDDVTVHTPFDASSSLNVFLHHADIILRNIT